MQWWAKRAAGHGRGSRSSHKQFHFLILSQRKVVSHGSSPLTFQADSWTIGGASGSRTINRAILLLLIYFLPSSSIFSEHVIYRCQVSIYCQILYNSFIPIHAMHRSWLSVTDVVALVLSNSSVHLFKGIKKTFIYRFCAEVSWDDSQTPPKVSPWSNAVLQKEKKESVWCSRAAQQESAPSSGQEKMQRAHTPISISAANSTIRTSLDNEGFAANERFP